MCTLSSIFTIRSSLLIKNQLVSGGELVLKSLVINGDETRCLIPNDSYAKMRNVYFISSAKMLKIWLENVVFLM